MSLAFLWIDGFTALKHLHERLDLPFPASFGLHVLRAKGDRKAVLRAQSPEHFLGFGYRIDSGLQVVRYCHGRSAIGATPATIPLGSIDPGQAETCHPACLYQ